MIGSTMSVPVLHRFLIAALRALSLDVPDPWETGEAQAALIDNAKADALPQQAADERVHGVEPD